MSDNSDRPDDAEDEQKGQTRLPTTLPSVVGDLLSPRALRVRDVDPALLLPGIEFIQTVCSKFKPEELAEVRRRARRSASVERALLHLLRIERFVRAGDVTWKAVERHLRLMIEREEAN